MKYQGCSVLKKNISFFREEIRLMSILFMELGRPNKGYINPFDFSRKQEPIAPVIQT